MNSLRVLLDARMVSENIHGIGRYVVNLAQGLHRLGHRVTILSSHHQTVEIIGVDSVENVIPCLLPFAHPLEAVELTQITRRGQFDINHFPSFAVPAILPPRTVLTVHDLIHLHPPTRLIHQIYYRTLVKRALKTCEKIIAVSEWTKKDLASKLGTPLEKISVVRNGLEEKWFQAMPESSSPLPSPYFLALSNPKPHKNLSTLILACQKLWDKNHVFNLALSLGGKEFPKDLKLPETHKHKIRILKNLEAQELLRYFKHSRAVLSSSLLEGFDYPAAEGLVLNKNVIISRGSAHDEFSGSKLNFYSPADDAGALAHALAKCLEGADDGTKASHNISTLKKMLDETLKVYTAIRP